MGLGEEKHLIHMTGFPLTKSGGYPSQSFLNRTSSSHREMDSLRFHLYLSSLLVIAMLKGHSVSLPLGLFWLEQLLKKQKLA